MIDASKLREALVAVRTARADHVALESRIAALTTEHDAARADLASAEDTLSMALGSSRLGETSDVTVREARKRRDAADELARGAAAALEMLRPRFKESAITLEKLGRIAESEANDLAGDVAEHELALARAAARELGAHLSRWARAHSRNQRAPIQGQLQRERSGIDAILAEHRIAANVAAVLRDSETLEAGELLTFAEAAAR